MAAILPLKPKILAFSEYFGNIVLPQLLIFHMAGGKPALFKGHNRKGQLLWNILQYGQVLSTQPVLSIHLRPSTHTSDILSKYSKLLFGLFLQAMAKADKPLIAQADGY